MTKLTDKETYGRDSKNMRLIGRSTLADHGDAGQVQVTGDIAYIGHMGHSRVGSSIVDVSDPTEPRLITQLGVPSGTHSHKVQVVDDLLLVNYERNRFERNARQWQAGLMIYDIEDVNRPKEVGFFEVSGKGVHRMTCWQMPYVYMSASAEGHDEQIFMILDVSDPAHPKEISRWWLPKVPNGGNRKYTHHHPIIRSDRAYCSWWDAGLVTLDISDLEQPKLVHHLELDPQVSSHTHTALPLPDTEIVILVDEAISSDDPLRSTKHVWVIDIADEHSPHAIARFPVPEEHYRRRGGTFGPHNVHEMRPNSFVSSEIIHVTYNNAGLRVVDISNPRLPTEVSYFVPMDPSNEPIQINDVYVRDDALIFMTDKVSGGLYIVQQESAT